MASEWVVLSPKRARGPWLLALQVVRVARQDCCSGWANVACGAIGDKIQEPSSGQPKSLLETKTAFFSRLLNPRFEWLMVA